MTVKPNNIFLTGFSTSGKTTLGRKLAQKLKMKFYDTDSLIEKMEGRSIAAIFREDGEKYFRAVESDVIRQVISRRGRKVVALGGGAYHCRRNRDLIAPAGTVIYLSCSVAELYRRLKNKKDRPLLALKGEEKADKNTIRTLLDRRKDNYNKADYRVATTSKSVTLSINKIVDKVKNARNQD